MDHSNFLTAKREICCICGADNLTLLKRIAHFPVYMGATITEKSQDIFSDQVWGICDSCGLVQLLELLPLAVLYLENHNQEAVGETWLEHHREFANFINETSEMKVLEIGGAHGKLASNLLGLNNGYKYTVVEPSPGNFHPECTVVTDYIENQTHLVKLNSSIVHSHVLEHLYKPRDFIQLMSANMNLGSKMYISFPNIEELLRTGGANSLNFEHTYFLTPEQLKPLVECFGFELLRIQSYRKHSYFWELERSQVETFSPVSNIQEKAEQFLSLWENLGNFVCKTNLRLVEKDIPTYVFGAHVFTQALLQLGLEVKSIAGILDNAGHKQGKRLYGSDFLVFAPEIISKLSKVRVVLRATHYQEEIRKQLVELNPQVQIIE